MCYQTIVTLSRERKCSIIPRWNSSEGFIEAPAGESKTVRSKPIAWRTSIKLQVTPNFYWITPHAEFYVRYTFSIGYQNCWEKMPRFNPFKCVAPKFMKCVAQVSLRNVSILLDGTFKSVQVCQSSVKLLRHVIICRSKISKLDISHLPNQWTLRKPIHTKQLACVRVAEPDALPHQIVSVMEAWFPFDR